ncbi:MAG: Hsp70 family protein [Spirochaetota bacterium]
MIRSEPSWEDYVENSVIAVQIANGTFVPVLNTSSAKRRRLVLTTVRDNQTNVKIDLFRGSDESMSDPEYVGSLVIDNLEPAEKGSADISVLLGVDENGSLNATATDTKSGEYQSLSVGLEELEQDGYDVPDFQLSDEELTLDELSMEEEEIGGEGEAEVPAGDEEPFGDFDLGDFETELAEARETTGDEAEPPTEEVAETPSRAWRAGARRDRGSRRGRARVARRARA